MELILLRHPPVRQDWQGRCYGRSDIGLSRQGQRMARDLAAELTIRRPALVIHSGMRRTQAIAWHVASPVSVDRRWQERDFGDWEGQSWQTIYRRTGSAMDGMITAPQSFRPGGGETTAEMIDRVRRALLDLPDAPRIAIIAHGGPIAAARHLLEKLPLDDLARAIPAQGALAIVTFDRSLLS